MGLVEGFNHPPRRALSRCRLPCRAQRSLPLLTGGVSSRRGAGSREGGAVTDFEQIRQALRPEVRRATNISRRRTAPQPPADYRAYGDRKPYVIAETLTALHGPTKGVVALPRHLDWSGHAEYDLNRPARLAGMYKVVLTEASTVEDLNAWLDADLLRRLWPTLWLPPQLRQRWEEAFPELAAARSEAA